MRKFFSILMNMMFAFIMIGAFALSTGMKKNNEPMSDMGKIKADEVMSNEGTQTGVYACGRLTGIYEQTNGVLVMDVVSIEGKDGKKHSPAKGKIKSGDYILSANGKVIESKEDLADVVNDKESDFVEIRYIRDGKEHVVSLDPVKGDDEKSYLGIWIKDDLAGIGTITYYTNDKKFGALGHGIGDGTKAGQLLDVNSGDLYKMELSKIKKGKPKDPGELAGVVYFGNKSHLGTLDGNSDNGIFGTLDDEEWDEYTKGDDFYEIAKESEVMTKKAQIISYISGQKEKYDIKILAVDHDVEDNNKKLVIEVTDEKLIDLTGGIIQGMSGSPIIQDGKIIGAVTHVFVNDPTEGYGILIEDMMK